MHILSPVTDNCPSWKSGRRNESMLPDRVSNAGPLTYESGALPIALRGPAPISQIILRLGRFFNHHEDPSLSSLFYLLDQFIMSLDISGRSRKENSQKLTQFSSRSHPRHLMGKKTAQKDTITLRLGQFFNNHEDPLLSSLFYLLDQFINQPWYKWQESIRMYLSVRSHSDWSGF